MQNAALSTSAGGDSVLEANKGHLLKPGRGVLSSTTLEVRKLRRQFVYYRRAVSGYFLV